MSLHTCLPGLHPHSMASMVSFNFRSSSYKNSPLISKVKSRSFPSHPYYLLTDLIWKWNSRFLLPCWGSKREVLCVRLLERKGKSGQHGLCPYHKILASSIISNDVTNLHEAICTLHSAGQATKAQVDQMVLFRMTVLHHVTTCHTSDHPKPPVITSSYC